MAAVATSSPEKFIEASARSMESSPSRRVSDAAASSDSVSVVSSTPDHSDQPSSPSNPHRDVDVQYSAAELKSEEYRQLFRLPPDEVLIQDFNCACQESILLQGHMYVFAHFICFYSNIFGFETKKVIPFAEITCIRRAKTAGIFPNAIEIIAGGKKYFFASFLSRDEAFILINDGWLQHNSGTNSVAEQQESNSESCSQDSGPVFIENVQSFNPSNESESIVRNEDAVILEDPNPPPSVEDEVVSVRLATVQENVEEEAQPALVTGSSARVTSLTWKEEEYDAPEIPEEYTRVAMAKFPITVEQFFTFFFSDAAAGFLELFHKRCGDKDLKSSPWCPHETHGHSRDVSFQHPIKLYLGARCGSCQENQKYRVYRNSHLVIKTSQQILDVPYGDHFCVEGLWDLVADGEAKENCVLHVYVNVPFSKRTIWKGKIVQNTVDECREAYATWIECANEVLKQKNLEKQVESPEASVCQNDEVHAERQAENADPLRRSRESIDPIRIQQPSASNEVEHRVGNFLKSSFIYVTPVFSLLKELMVNFSAFLRSRGHLPVLLVTFAAILLLMQFSIVVLLARPPQVHMISQADHISGMHSQFGDKSSEALGWLEKRMHFLKEEMLMVESRIEHMILEHKILKAQLENLELHKRKQI